MATTSAVNFGSLVGAQLTALIEAEVEGAEKTSEYIESVGFEKREDGTMRLRMVTFEMARRDVDGEVRKHLISVPVLTLVPIPLLTIEEADIEFSLQVEDVKKVDTKEKSQPASAALASSGARVAAVPIMPRSAAQPSKVRLLTRLARTTHQDSKVSSDLKVTVKIAQSPFPLGIERLLNTADLSVEDKIHER